MPLVVIGEIKSMEKAELEKELENLYLKVAKADSTENTQEQEKESQVSTETHERLKFHQTAEESSPQEEKKRTFRLRRVVPMMGLFAFLLVLVAVFLWPMTYQYYAINFGKTSPLKINEGTGNTANLDSKDRLQSSSPVSVTETITAAKNDTVSNVPTANENKLKDQTKNLFSPSPPNIMNKGKYAIQVKAYPEAKKNDALIFVEHLKKSQSDIHMEKIHIPGRGDWYRILLGHFASHEEASHYMKEKNLINSLPGCFVQVKSEE